MVDVCVIKAFECGVLDLPDFYFKGDDYRYHLDSQAKHRFIEVLREQFNTGVRWNGRVLKWDTVIEQKTMELSKYLVGRSYAPEFQEPSPKLDELKNQEIRDRILSMTKSEREKLNRKEHAT